MEKTIRKVGIMGGTFDPIHIGHLILGEAAYEQFGLDEVWFLPAGNPPHKRNRAGRAKDAQRVEMVRRAIASNPHFVLCTKEMEDEGYTYSYRTLEAMRKEHPGTEFYFIIGADSLFTFDEWKEPARICRACTLIVAVRDHASSDELNQEIIHLEQKMIEIKNRQLYQIVSRKNIDTIFSVTSTNGIGAITSFNENKSNLES